MFFSSSFRLCVVITLSSASVPVVSGVARPFAVPPPLKRSGTCPVRCPFLFRAIVKRNAITGSRLNRHEYEASPPVANLKYQSHGTMADCTCFPGSLTRKMYRKKIPENAGNVPDVPVHARSGARSCTGNYQTACDDRLKAGPLRGDPASPRVDEGTGGARAGIAGIFFRALRADVPLFPENLTRKLYIKKIPENTLNVPGVPGNFRYRNSPALSGTSHSPKISGKLPGPVPVHVPDNCQTACDDRLKAGLLRETG